MVNSVELWGKSFIRGWPIWAIWVLMTKNRENATFNHCFGSPVCDCFVLMCDMASAGGTKSTAEWRYVNLYEKKG